jgi:hypothetical protein
MADEVLQVTLGLADALAYNEDGNWIQLGVV